MFEAENGVNGKGQDKYGRNGEDLVIEVPVGTTLLEVDEDGLKSLWPT
jgi:GTP-binding protein